MQTDQYTMLSGGAKGADTEWHKACALVGITDIRHIREPWARDVDSSELRRMGIKPIRLTYDDMAEAKPIAQRISDKLGRKLSAVYSHYQIRNWFQVKPAQAVFAVGIIEDNYRYVSGGTGYAVEMAVMHDKPCYVFDQEMGQWYTYDSQQDEFIPYHLGVPILTKVFAGIGTRDINDVGIRAIQDVVKQTFQIEQHG